MKSGDDEFRLEDLIQIPSLGLRLVVSPDGCLTQAVVGAHSVEIEHPARWLDRDWVMLTTGLQLASEETAQRELVAELSDAGVAALGFGIGIVHSELPPALVDEAEKRSLPIFTIPLRTPFRAIVSAVFGATLSHEVRSWHRLTVMQQYLMDSLGDESPRETALRRLASLVEARTGIVSDRGEVLFSTGELPGDLIVEQVRHRPSPTTHFEVDGLHGYACPITLANASRIWLIVANRSARAPHPLARAAAQATVPLIAAMSRLHEEERLHEAAMRRAVMDTLLDMERDHDARIVTAQALASDVDIAAGVAVLSIAGGNTGDDSLEELLADASRKLRSMEVRFLATVRANQVVVLIRSPFPEEEFAAWLDERPPLIRAGLGRTVTEPLLVKESHADANLALQEPPKRGKRCRLLRYDDLNVTSVLVYEVPVQRLAPKIEEWLKPVKAHEVVYDTLLAYLDYEMDVGRTAAALGIHGNSVRYRLSKAEDLLGARLRSSGTIVALHVALHRSGEANGRSRRGLPNAS